MCLPSKLVSLSWHTVVEACRPCHSFAWVHRSLLLSCLAKSLPGYWSDLQVSAAFLAIASFVPASRSPGTQTEEMRRPFLAAAKPVCVGFSCRIHGR